jgi:hypothetical protein
MELSRKGALIGVMKQILFQVTDGTLYFQGLMDPTSSPVPISAPEEAELFIRIETTEPDPLPLIERATRDPIPLPRCWIHYLLQDFFP